ncbi:hypothetical protein D0T50_10175 [Bacteroides sp. 214]|uniref:peptidoglycan DD-metalloendopeptidase family protein n=1 Tax=Bacteroides sp. 214 TaxID=2302935 RepID=UPI0013D71A5F|nr:peptidoglycan DD-metalloendopeptidase family protein [Bacteroides sp. 214]NDW13260.1 hypothetical protein [Bacteroides sp. 214]
MTKDLNKGLSGITYNCLNLPSKVYIDNPMVMGYNTYTYAADGRKLKVVHRWDSNRWVTPMIGEDPLDQTKTTEYVGPIVYEKINNANPVRKRVLFDGGYIDEQGLYTYYLSDHLGNVQLVLDSEERRVQFNDYYPFGLPFAESYSTIQGAQPYKYNGKELDMLHGLNWYDYGARMMSMDLPHTPTPDPLAERHYNWSPYVYCLNNPIKYIDPDGKREWPVNEKYNGKTRRHENNYGASRSGNRKHSGVDINFGSGSDDLGAPVLATHDGEVVRVVKYADDKDGGGNRVKIAYKKEEKEVVATYYMHLDAISEGLKVGDKVSEGDQIGTIGRSGKGKSNEYTPHLHYEIHENGQKIDPATSKSALKDPQKNVNNASSSSLSTKEQWKEIKRLWKEIKEIFSSTKTD